MTNTRIYKVLTNCSAIDLNRFLKFVKSPYFNKNEAITRLAVLIIDSLKNSAPLEDKVEVWKRVKPDTEFLDVKYRKLFNELLVRFEHFLAVETLQDDKLLMSNLLLKSIKKKKLPNLIEKHIAQSESKADRAIDQSSDFYLQKYYQLKNIHNIKSNYEKKLDQRKGIRVTYSDLSKNLDAFYSIEKLRLSTELSAWQKMYKSEEMIELNNVKAIIKSNNLDDLPTVAIYYLMNKIYLEDHEDSDFKLLRQLSESNIQYFPLDEQREIYDALISYGIVKARSGSPEFRRITLELYDWAIEKEIILENGYLSPTSFRNYVFMGLRIGEYDRVENFISSKINLIAENRRQNALNLNLARVAFYRNNYENVISFLAKVNYDDIWYNVNSKILLLATYYELNEMDTLLSNLDSFKTFLRREKSLGDAARKTCISFCSFLKKLTVIGHQKRKVRILQEKIIEEKNVANKQWLLEKIEALL